jgi:hypothetical protein
MLGDGALASGQTVASQVGLSLAWAAAIVALFVPLAVHAYNRNRA